MDILTRSDIVTADIPTVIRRDSRDWRINGDHLGKRQPRKKQRRTGTKSGVLAALRREGERW